MNQISIQYHKTPVGELILGVHDNQLCLMDYKYRRMRTSIDNRLKKGLNAEYVEDEHTLFQAIKEQLSDYFIGKRKAFSVPVLTVGSDFQQQVWKALKEIEYGQTVSYLDLAKNLNNEKAVRAVASANGANALSIIIPCHRIIGSNGNLVGYAGGLAAKKRLLLLEQENSENTIKNTQQLSLF